MTKPRVNEPNNRELREAISEITERNNGLPEGNRLQKVHEQIPRIESLRTSITLIEQVNPNDERSWKFNCFQYAFNRRVLPPKIKSVLDNQQGGPRLDFGSKFIEFLIQNKKKYFVGQEESRPGCIVIYSDNKKVMHAGKVIENGFIVSKWGYRGHLWQHRLYEIPISYGNDAERFGAIPSEDGIVAAFLEYARLNSNGRGQVKIPERLLKRSDCTSAPSAVR